LEWRRGLCSVRSGPCRVAGCRPSSLGCRNHRWLGRELLPRLLGRRRSRVSGQRRANDSERDGDVGRKRGDLGRSLEWRASANRLAETIWAQGILGSVEYGGGNCWRRCGLGDPIRDRARGRGRIRAEGEGWWRGLGTDYRRTPNSGLALSAGLAWRCSERPWGRHACHLF
jgi:hypothetical protein